MTDVQHSDDLASLRAKLSQLDAEIKNKQREEVKVLVDGFAKKLAALGLSVDEAVKELQQYSPKRRTRRVSVQPSDEFVLYANPKDPRQTWGGEGQQPAWVRDYLDKGGALEKLKV